MTQQELAEVFVAASDDELVRLCGEHRQRIDVELAWAVKDIWYRAWHSDPPRAARTADVLREICKVNDHAEVRAITAWTAGIAAIIRGEMEHAIEHLDSAAIQFERISQPEPAAQTKVSQVIALSMLGRYDEAKARGGEARDVFLALGDFLAAGKIELNLGNLCFRRDQYPNAAVHYRASLSHLAATNDIEHIVLSEKGLADTLAWQQDFPGAADLYRRIMDRARSQALPVIAYSAMSNLGLVELAQGNYQQALRDLGQARREFEALQLPQFAAVSEQGLADVYLELNMLREAMALYESAIAMFSHHAVWADAAWAQSQYGRALAQSNRITEARTAFANAHALFVAEGNTIGTAQVTLREAELALKQSDLEDALKLATSAERSLGGAKLNSWYEMARWVRAEALRCGGAIDAAFDLIQDVLRNAEALLLHQIRIRCLTSLGSIAIARGDLANARVCYQRAITLIESQRSGLPGEELRTSYLESNLQPYIEVLKLTLSGDGGDLPEQALRDMERIRSRALLDLMDTNDSSTSDFSTASAHQTKTEIRACRTGLNWCYRRLLSGNEEIGSIDLLQQKIVSLEATQSELMRRLEQERTTGLATEASGPAELDIPALKAALGEHSVLVEYFCLDGEILASIVSSDGIFLTRHLAREADVNNTVQQLRFQTDTLRHSAARMLPYMPELTRRTCKHLASLHAALIAPIQAMLGSRRLVVVPHRALHYVPFEALFDGGQYVIEAREVCRTPSAAVLLKCLDGEPSIWRSALIVGVGGTDLPHIEAELDAIAPLFANATVFRGAEATTQAIALQASSASVVHLACHGQFRPDSPFYSALYLADGVLTVRDAYELRLSNCGLVTLSACETGVSLVAPGDELIGLARGFFSAGVPSVVASLWTVDDEATAEFMHCFYTNLVAGKSANFALRAAQIGTLARFPHPYFWAAFVLHGRW